MKKIIMLSKELVSLEKAQTLGYTEWNGVNVADRIATLEEEIAELRKYMSRI